MAYSNNINPRLYRRPLNVKVGNVFYYVPDVAIATDAIPMGDEVEIIKKVAMKERGEALVLVRASNGTQHNVLLKHLAVIF